MQQRWYTAHGGGQATMLFDSRELSGLLFLAHGILAPGQRLESHVDPYEEVYYVLQGEALMTVGAEEAEVRAGDAVHIPAGARHGMVNHRETVCVVLVAAAMPS